MRNNSVLRGAFKITYFVILLGFPAISFAADYIVDCSVGDLDKSVTVSSVQGGKNGPGLALDPKVTIVLGDFSFDVKVDDSPAGAGTMAELKITHLATGSVVDMTPFLFFSTNGPDFTNAKNSRLNSIFVNLVFGGVGYSSVGCGTAIKNASSPGP